MDDISDSERKRSRKDVVDIVISSETDWISQLPEHIIHHILSFLCIRDVTRASVLSKTWYVFSTSFPASNFDFSQCSFGLGLERIQDREVEFARLMHDSLLRKICANVRIQKFRLSFPCSQSQVSACIDHSLQMVIQGGVKELDVYLTSDYVLPSSVFSAEALTVLRLCGCYIRLCLPDCAINWPSLRVFSLHKVFIDKQIIQNLNLMCPLLEKISLVHCSRLETIELSGFTKLKKVKVKVMVVKTDPYGNYHLKKVEINVPNLQILNYQGGEQECQIDVAACTNLKVLKLKSPIITSQLCHDIVSKLRDLRVLSLHSPLLKTINISNMLLEKLKFSSHYELKATIHAPRLRSFESKFGAITFPLLDTSNVQEVTIKLFHDVLDLHLFRKVRQYLLNFYQINRLTLHIKACSITYNIPNYIDRFSVPALPDIKQLKLKIDSSLLTYETKAYVEKNYDALVDCLLWMCRPESLLLVSGWASNNVFMNVLCKKLIHRERNYRCCTYSNVKCWQHDLKGIEIEHYKGKAVRSSLTCAELLESLQSLCRLEKIIFIFKWRSLSVSGFLRF